MVAVSNGTMAIQLALRSLGIKGKVITTPFTWKATATAISWENLTPVFALEELAPKIAVHEVALSPSFPAI